MRIAARILLCVLALPIYVGIAAMSAIILSVITIAPAAWALALLVAAYGPEATTIHLLASVAGTVVFAALVSALMEEAGWDLDQIGVAFAIEIVVLIFVAASYHYYTQPL